jgi:hypothetical protein
MRKCAPIHEAAQKIARSPTEKVPRTEPAAQRWECFQSGSPERLVPSWRTTRSEPLILIALTLLNRINLRYYL